MPADIPIPAAPPTAPRQLAPAASQVVACTCGAKLRLPSPAPSTARCPKCARTFRVAVSAPLAATPPLSPTAPPPRIAAVAPVAATPAPGAICPICRTAIAPDDPAGACPSCHQVHHSECWHEIGGCAVYGCAGAPAAAKADAPAHAPTAWGDTKSCPVCGERIKSIAVKCRYCGTDFDTVDPLTPDDMAASREAGEQTRALRGAMGTIFGLSILGILAPIMLIVALIWVLPRRQRLRAAGPMFVALGWASVGVSALYTLLIIVFWISTALS